MFSTIVAWVVFVLTSLVFVITVLDSIFNADKNRLERKLLRAAGYTGPFYNWAKISLYAVLWFVSGVYLFG